MKNIGLKIVAIMVAILFHYSINAQAMNTNAAQNSTSIFPQGNKAPAEYFTGTVWVQTLLPNDDTLTTVISNVVFEPGARNNWHKHPAGQIRDGQPNANQSELLQKRAARRCVGSHRPCPCEKPNFGQSVGEMLPRRAVARG